MLVSLWLSVLLLEVASSITTVVVFVVVVVLRRLVSLSSASVAPVVVVGVSEWLAVVGAENSMLLFPMIVKVDTLVVFSLEAR